MLGSFYRSYLNTYRGISREIWMLSLVMLINRSGAMVLPFLSVYLKGELEFGLTDIGIILSLFGVGSLLGTMLGGWLTDKFGFFRVQFASLCLSGLGYFLLEPVESFWGIALGFFLITLVSDSFRPANAAAVAAYAKPENITRAFSLNRMAINLGFTVGPAVGGLIAVYSYSWLFYIDGVSCWIGAAFFGLYFWKRTTRDRKDAKLKAVEIAPVASPYSDRSFILFCLLTAAFAFVFFQFLFTLPLFYRDVALLTEAEIGLLLALNGLVVFGLEMPLVYILGKKVRLSRIVAVGCILTGLAFGILVFGSSLALLITSMVILSVGEIFVMPFLSTYTANRSTAANRGKYMGLYGMAYSAAFILAPSAGTAIVASYNYSLLWITVAAISVFIAWGFLRNLRKPTLSINP